MCMNEGICISIYEKTVCGCQLFSSRSLRQLKRLLLEVLVSFVQRHRYDDKIYLWIARYAIQSSIK
jgi:hypothetical protein